jgi:hypothetical protein
MGARWYNPQTATFTSRDTYPGSVGAYATLNRYTYGLNNPLRYSDPTGHMNYPDYDGNETSTTGIPGLADALAELAASTARQNAPLPIPATPTVNDLAVMVGGQTGITIPPTVSGTAPPTTTATPTPTGDNPPSTGTGDCDPNDLTSFHPDEEDCVGVGGPVVNPGSGFGWCKTFWRCGKKTKAKPATPPPTTIDPAAKPLDPTLRYLDPNEQDKKGYKFWQGQSVVKIFLNPKYRGDDGKSETLRDDSLELFKQAMELAWLLYNGSGVTFQWVDKETEADFSLDYTSDDKFDQGETKEYGGIKVNKVIGAEMTTGLRYGQALLDILRGKRGHAPGDGIDILAHELGHYFNFAHESGGFMEPETYGLDIESRFLNDIRRRRGHPAGWGIPGSQVAP